MASQEANSARTLTASCYCKSVQYSIAIPSSHLPLPVHVCHCNICRYTHGTLCIFHSNLPKAVSPEFIAPSSLDKMTGYMHPKAQAERFFCSQCGCHVGDRGLDLSAGDTPTTTNEWTISTALFSEHGDDVFDIGLHCFTTGGSGLFEFLPKIRDRDMETWNPAPDSGWWSSGIKDEPPEQEFDSEGSEVLRAACHCGGISFTIPRPTIPGIKDDPYVSKYTSPKDSSKWIACLDACDDCRLQCGTLVTAWTFVPRAQIQPPMPLALAPYGTMKTFVSSPGVLRGFCGTCGATAIYSCDDRIPAPESQIIDVSVGLLRAPEGVLAENWLTWRAGRVANPEGARKFNSAFVDSLAEGSKKWSMEKYGDAPDFTVD